MSIPADNGGGGSSTPTVTLDMIRNVRPGGLRTAASALHTGSKNLTTHHTDFSTGVHRPLQAGYAWTGHGQPQAAGVTSANAAKIDGVAKRLDPAQTVLDGLAGFLDSARKQVSQLDRDASDLHVTLSPRGDVTVNDIPGEHPDDAKKRSVKAGQLLGQVQAVLMAASDADGHAAGTLNALQQGDPTTPPPLEGLHLDYWKKNFSDPKFWTGWLATALSAIPGTLESGALKFSSMALSQYELSKILTNPAMVEAAKDAASRGFGTAFNMEYMLSKLGPAAPWLTKGLPESVPFLSKIPYVGWAATGLGIGFDRMNGEGWGQAVTSNVLPTLAGTAATEGTLAVLGATAIAGGPATMVAVGVGVGVAFGVGYVVDHWDGITDGIGDAASSVGHALGGAASSVGHALSSIF